MKHSIKYLLGGAILVLVMALVFAPVAAQDQRPAAGEGGTIINGYFGSDPVPFNPLVCSESTCIEISGFLFPGLIAVDPNTGNYTPTGAGPGAMTTSYDISADGLTYTFHLRDDYKWNDGTPVTSADFMYSWNAIKSGLLQNTLYTSILDTVADMQAPDATTLVVTMKQADCRALGSASVPAMPSHILPTDYAALNDTDFNLNPTVTGGALKFSNYTPSSQVSLVADQNYPDASLGYVQPSGMIYKNVPDQVVMVQQFLAGETNFLDSPSVGFRADVRKAADAGDVQVYSYAGDFFDYLAFNLADPTNPQNGLDADGNPIDQGHHPVLGDVRVRQAISMGVDMDALIQGAAFGEATRMTSFLGANSWAYDKSLAPIAYNPEQAKAALDAAGWKDEDGDGIREAHGALYATDGTPLSFVMYGNEGNTRRAAEGQLIQDQLKAIGVDAQYQGIDFGTWQDIVNAQTFDAVMLAWQLGYPDDPDQTQLFTPISDVVGSGNDFTSYNNPQFTDLNKQARTVPGCDQTARANIYHQMQKILQDDAPYLWMYTINGMYAARSSVVGFDPRPSNKWWNVDTWYVQQTQ